MGKKRKQVKQGADSSARASGGLTGKPLTRTSSADATSKPPAGTSILRCHSADALWGRVREVAHEPSFLSDFPRLQRASSGLKRASTAVAQAHAEVPRLADHPTTHPSRCPSRSPLPVALTTALALTTGPRAHHCSSLTTAPRSPLALTSGPLEGL